MSYFMYVLPALLLGLWAQTMVNTRFNKYSKVLSARGLSAADVARYILDKNGLSHIPVNHIAGRLTDHFDPTRNTVNLSDAVYSSTSVAAIGVAAHEVGHAIQHAKGYKPMEIRRAILPISAIGSKAWFLIFILGLMSSIDPLINTGIILFSAIVLFQLVTLPVEFNASSRAVNTLETYGLLNEQELEGTKKVLSAAAMTYVAALIASIMELLRLLAMAERRR